ncbi:hypothetical protein ADL00_34310 [Streptomyces sp. AS58]|nr:hypothetical protein ADL00_34310 [Streptomyces sp. AS58]
MTPGPIAGSVHASPAGEAVRATLTTWSPATSSALFACGVLEDLSAVEAEARLCGDRSGS